jgi:NADH dehydrogenase
MILVTGGTGFIGQALIRQLISSGYEVRSLIKPSNKTPNLPRGVPVEVVVASLMDLRGIRAAMKDVQTVIHLVTGENKGSKTDLLKIDIESTKAISTAAAETGVDRIIYLSHLDADRASAYPTLKTKGISENYIKACGVDYTIFRTALVYGPSDHLTEGIRTLMQAIPFFFLLPGDGTNVIQPIWIEDLVGCITSSLDDQKTRNKVFEVGGGEYMSIQEIVQIVKEKIGLKKRIITIHPAYLRFFTVIMENAFPSFPVSTFWLDYLSANRTCTIDSLPREFGILPARFAQKIGYLKPGKRTFPYKEFYKKPS